MLAASYAALEACPPWVLVATGFAAGAFPRRLWRTFRRYMARPQTDETDP